LGRFTARALATAGATVVVCGRREQPLRETVHEIQATGARAFGWAADVTDRAAVDGLVQQVEREVGPLDVLVNNAGVITPIGPLWEVDPDEWWRAFEINVRGPFLCCRAVLPAMLERGRGRIVNVISGAVGHAHPNASAYANSKSALAHLTRSLGSAAAARGVQVFAVDPGTMTRETGMQQILYDSDEGRRYYPGIQRTHDEGRGVPPERSARLIARLASGEAGALTGRILGVGDDLDELLRRADDIVRDDLYVLGMRR
jgi:NAD(P)-dependent dehydrogenase (short-subunit alcohol dehydrogenase family)